jgi:hypothetical protein
VKYMRLLLGDVPEIVMGSMSTYWIQLLDGGLSNEAFTVEVEIRTGHLESAERLSKTVSRGGYTTAERLVKV